MEDINIFSYIKLSSFFFFFFLFPLLFDNSVKCGRRVVYMKCNTDFHKFTFGF